MKELLNRKPVVMHKKIPYGHLHVITVAVNETYLKPDFFSDISNLTMSVLEDEFITNNSVQSIIKATEDRGLNFSLEESTNLLLKKKNIWKKPKGSSFFKMSDFYERVTSLFNFENKKGECFFPLEISKEALQLIQGCEFKANIRSDQSVEIKVDSPHSQLQLNINDVTLSVSIQNIILTVMPSGYAYVSFVIEYSGLETGTAPCFSDLSYAVKKTSTAHDRGFAIDFATPKLEGQFSTYEENWQNIVNDQGLDSKIKYRKLSKLLPGLGYSITDDNGCRKVKFTELALKLLNLPVNSIIDDFSKVRLHSYFLCNVEQNIASAELDYLGFLFSKQYTPDYSVPTELIGVEKVIPLDNKVHYCAQEGGSVFLRVPEGGCLHKFDNLFLYDRGFKTYFPLSLINLHEYHLLIQSLHRPFSNFNSFNETNNYYQDALNVRLNYRTLIASQLAQHNKVHVCWRTVFKLDNLHAVLAEDVRELHENSSKFYDEKKSLESQLKELKQEQKELVLEKHHKDTINSYDGLARLVSALVITMTILGVDKSFLPLDVLPYTILGKHTDFAIVVFVISCIVVLIPGRSQKKKRQHSKELLKSKCERISDKIFGIEVELKTLEDMNT
jgi:hypothetical protein